MTTQWNAPVQTGNNQATQQVFPIVRSPPPPTTATPAQGQQPPKTPSRMQSGTQQRTEWVLDQQQQQRAPPQQLYQQQQQQAPPQQLYQQQQQRAPQQQLYQQQQQQQQAPPQQLYQQHHQIIGLSITPTQKCRACLEEFVVMNDSDMDEFLAHVVHHCITGPRLEERNFATLPMSMLTDALLPPPRNTFTPTELEWSLPWKGIQGDSNSCYFDTLIVSLFLFSSALDSELVPPDGAEDNRPTRASRERLLDIVRELRNRLFVPSPYLLRLRQLIDAERQQAGVSPKFQFDVQDVTDLARFLFENVLSMPHLVQMDKPSTPAGATDTTAAAAAATLEYIVPLLVEPGMFSTLESMPYPFLWQLLSQVHPLPQLLPVGSSARNIDKRLLLVQMPRLPHGQRTYRGIRPDDKIEWPAERSGDPSRTTPLTLHLRAVICIELSHYVAFVCNNNRQWFFSDSMADRKGERCFPELYPVPNCANMLAFTAIALLNDEKLTPLQRRLLSDAYLVIYES